MNPDGRNLVAEAAIELEVMSEGDAMQIKPGVIHLSQLLGNLIRIMLHRSTTSLNRTSLLLYIGSIFRFGTRIKGLMHPICSV